MENSANQKRIKDRGGARSGSDRRHQLDSSDRPEPERRSGKERRDGFDRRADLGQQRDPEKGAVERRDAFRKSK
jgi:hypothetical protein